MNLLIITQMYSQPDDEGDNKPTKTVNYFAKEWARQGHKVVVIHCASKFPLPYYYIPKFVTDRLIGKTSNIVFPKASRLVLKRNEDGVKVYRFPMMKVFPGQGYNQKAIKNQEIKIQNSLAKLHFIPDVVLGHFVNPSLRIVTDLASLYNAKSSIVFHQDCNERNIEKYNMTESLKKVGAIGARSSLEAKQVKKLLKLTYAPFVCCSGVPNEVVENAERVCTKHSNKDIKYIYVGSLIKRKNLDSVIKAFCNKYNCTSSKSTLEIVGGGVEEENFKLLAKGLDKGKRIYFVGRVEREEAMKHMKAADVFTLISENEVFGMVYIEAMLQGCIVIASKGGGFDGIIKDGVNGFLCNPGDFVMLEKIYDRIEKLNPKERNEIGQNAINTALHFSETEVNRDYLNNILEQNNATMNGVN